MRLKGRKRWGPGVLDAVAKDAEKHIELIRHGLASLRETEEPDLDDIQTMGVFEGSLEAFEWVVRAVRQGIDYAEFLDTADQVLRVTIGRQRALTRYGGSHHDWRDYASNTAWDRRTYAQIGHYSGEIDVITRMNRDYDLGLDPELVSEAKYFIY